MIGLSLSFCIKEICAGRIKIEDVAKLITSTRARTEQDWQELIQCYRESYWYDYPDEAEKVVRQLLDEGRIEQPRLIDDQHMPNISRTLWVSGEDEIEWADAGSRLVRFC